MHKTNTVDYAVVYDGEMWLELDDDEILHLNGGDVVVQKRNKYWPDLSGQLRASEFIFEITFQNY